MPNFTAAAGTAASGSRRNRRYCRLGVFRAVGDARRFRYQRRFRLTGVQPAILTLAPGSSVLPVASSLSGQLVVAGDLTIKAAQVYPTTGTGSLQQQIDAERAGRNVTPEPFLIASTGIDATIRFERASTGNPAAPWSAGGNLLVQAAHIVQAGVLRVPVGRLQLGSNSARSIGPASAKLTAPATATVDIAPGSLTSVSANGLNIPMARPPT